MKSVIILTLTIFIAIVSGKNLKKDIKDQTSVNPREVKSLGEFSNISPDATKLIKPKYAGKRFSKIIFSLIKINRT